MKKIFITLVAAFAITQFSYAQNNSDPWPTSGNVGIGTTAPQASLDLTVNRTKTAVGGVYSYFGKTNEVSNYAALQLVQSGATNAANRYWSFQTIEQGIANAGSIVFQPNGGNVGIGTATPAVPLHVVGSGINLVGSNTYNTRLGTGTTQQGILLGYNTEAGGGGMIAGSAVGGTANNLTFVTFDGSSWKESMRILGSGNVGIGTTTPHEALSVNGNIRSKQVKVEINNWPDYVFKPNYSLLSLKEVKTYIDKNQHLPDMPSEKDVIKDGLDLGETNRLLLKKVEELTLYLIEQNKQISNQQKINHSLQQQINKLAKRTSK